MKAYITKYALTSGIFEAEGSINPTNASTFIVDGAFAMYFHGKDWHMSVIGARLRAEEMRKAKVASLKKQLQKYQQLQLDIEPLPWGGKSVTR